MYRRLVSGANHPDLWGKCMSIRKTGFALLFLLFPVHSYSAESVFQDDITEKRFYWGLHAGQEADSEFDVGMLTFGYDFDDWISTELHLGKSNTLNLTGVGNDFFNVKANFISALFLRFNMRFEKINWYLLGGYGKTEFEADFSIGNTLASLSGFFPSGGLPTSGSESVDFSGPAYGFGVEIYGTPNSALTLSWIRYFEDSVGGLDVDFTTTNIGFVYHFDWSPEKTRY